MVIARLHSRRGFHRNEVHLLLSVSNPTDNHSFNEIQCIMFVLAGPV